MSEQGCQYHGVQGHCQACEIADLRAKLSEMATHAVQWQRQSDEWKSELKKQDARVARLEEVLDEYGGHYDHCAVMRYEKCDCGLDAAREEGS